MIILSRKNLIIVGLIIFMFSALLLAETITVPEEARDKRYGSLVGKIIDEQDIGIPGASITLYQLKAHNERGDLVHLIDPANYSTFGEYAFSDTDGNFCIGSLLKQSYLLHVEQHGYQPVDKIISFSSDQFEFKAGSIIMQRASDAQNKKIFAIKIRHQKTQNTGILKGIVVDVHDPFPFAKVKIIASDGTIRSVPLNSDGTFQADSLPAGPLSFMAQCENYDTIFMRDIKINEYSITDLGMIDMKLSRGHMDYCFEAKYTLVSGRVIDDKENGLPGVKIRLNYADNKKNQGAAVMLRAYNGSAIDYLFTDSEGYFCILALPKGNYFLSTELPNYRSAKQAMHIESERKLDDMKLMRDAPGNSFPRNIKDDKLGFGIITGTIIDENSQPIRDVKIKVIASDGTIRTPLPLAGTFFKIDSLPPGIATFIAEWEDQRIMHTYSLAIPRVVIEPNSVIDLGKLTLHETGFWLEDCSYYLW